MLLRQNRELQKLLPSSPAIWLLGVSLFFVPLPSIRFVGNVSISDVLFVGAIVMALVERLVSRGALISPAVRNICFAYLVVVVLLLIPYLGHELGLAEFSEWSGSHSYQSTLALPKNSKVLSGAAGAGDLGFIILLACLSFIPLSFLLMPVRHARETKFLLWCLAGGAIFGATFTVLYCNGFFPDHIDRSWRYLKRASGLTPHANILALSCLMALPGLYLLGTSTLHRLWKFGALWGLFIVWEAIGYSGSRSGLASFLVILALLWILSSQYWQTRILRGFAVVGLGVVTIVFATLSGAGANSQTSRALWRLLNGSAASDGARDVINSVALDQAIQSSLIGVGYDALRVAHNLYLQMFHVGGVLGFMAYCLSLAVPIIVLVRCLSIREISGVVVAMLALLLQLAIFAMVKNNPAEISVAMMLGLALLVGKVVLESESPFARTVATP